LRLLFRRLFPPFPTHTGTVAHRTAVSVKVGIARQRLSKSSRPSAQVSTGLAQVGRLFGLDGFCSSEVQKSRGFVRWRYLTRKKLLQANRRHQAIAAAFEAIDLFGSALSKPKFLLGAFETLPPFTGASPSVSPTFFPLQATTALQ